MSEPTPNTRSHSLLHRDMPMQARGFSQVWRHLRGRGFTLIECLCAVAVLSFTVAAVCTAIVTGQMHTAQGLASMRGMALAEAMIDEIVALPYKDPSGTAAALGPESGETSRSLFDNCDDYHGSSETANLINDQSGSLLPTEYQAFTRSVTCSTGSTTIGGVGTVSGLTVVVTVTSTKGAGTWTLTRFIPDPG